MEWGSQHVVKVRRTQVSELGRPEGLCKQGWLRSQSKPWAASGYSSISKLSYLMLSKDGEMIRFRFSLMRVSTGSALGREEGEGYWHLH